MADPTISARVKAGAAWLDQHRPGWLDRIDLIVLDVEDPEWCVIGQLDGEYDAELVGGPERAYELGMLAGPPEDDPDDDEYERLTKAWKAYVLDEGRRRAAACCPCRGPVCDTGCACPAGCPRELAEVLDG